MNQGLSFFSAVFPIFFSLIPLICAFLYILRGMVAHFSNLYRKTPRLAAMERKDGDAVVKNLVVFEQQKDEYRKFFDAGGNGFGKIRFDLERRNGAGLAAQGS